MSKRTYLIIILLLIVVDIVAGFWYLAARIEASEESRDIFESRVDSMQVLEADTVSETSVPDVFQMYSRDSFYVSNAPAVSSDPSTHYTSTKHIRLRWPESVNGNDSLDALERALLKRMFGNESVSLSFAVAQEMKPTFNTSQSLPFHTVSKAPAAQARFGNVSSLLAYPVMTSMKLLVMRVERRTYNGVETTTTASHLHYDRDHQRVLARQDIFSSGSDQRLLAVINAKIDQLNSKQQPKLNHAAQPPGDFQAKRKGLLFRFAPGTIAGTAEGTVEVFVDYGTLRPVFTPSFSALARDNEGFWDYKTPTID